ncbi:MAG: NAD(P)/FAD-dependent oxidoreductase [Thermoguttaceae bacterium]|nr:NAD(P)/FAD-dependent oxidoreductase [Thermoguttaceae bacterium]
MTKPIPTSLTRQSRFDLIVLGGGPSGLMAAIRAAERRQTTLLLEKNRKPGAKILISGGGRCNLTHDCDGRAVAAAFGTAGRFLHSPLAALGPPQLRQWFRAEGVPTKAEPDGKVFPQSDRAGDVLGALLRRLDRCGVLLAPGEPAIGIERMADGFTIVTPYRVLHAGAVIVATGGMSYSGCGTTGDGYGWLASLGHTVHPPRPALVPLMTGEGWVQRLAGIALSNVLVRVLDPGAAALPRRGNRGSLPPGVLAERRGAILFTHFGFSGPAVMDVSRAVTVHSAPHRLRLAVDFLPDMRADDLDVLLKATGATDGRKSVASLLPHPLPRRVSQSLMEQAGLDASLRAAELSRPERATLVGWLKRAEVSLKGSCGFDQAEVTAGGVALDEVDSRTMQSKLVPRLFITGEILDLDGFIGGFNLQAAFSTGWQAGSHA